MFISRHGTASDEDELIFNDFSCGETVISCSNFSNLFFFPVKNASLSNSHLVSSLFRLTITSARMSALILRILMRMQGFATVFRTNATKRFHSRLSQPLLQIQDPVLVLQQPVKPLAPLPAPTVHHLFFLLNIKHII